MLIMIPATACREVFKARCKKTKKLVALKKVLMENEKEGVCALLMFHSFNSK